MSAGSEERTNRSSDGGGQNANSLLKALAIALVLVIPIFHPAGSSFAETVVWLGDANGETEMTVGAGDYFDVYLWIEDAAELAGFECHISKTGPATWGTTASVGSWFGTDHTMSQDLGNPALRSQVLEDPTDLTGSGDLAIYHLYATEEGTIAVFVTAHTFVLGKTDSSKIEADVPATLYVTVTSGGLMASPPPSAEELFEDISGGDQVDISQDIGVSRVQVGQELLDSGTTWYVDDDTTVSL